jgi:DNA-binding beta-propeller fold protein YncE
LFEGIPRLHSFGLKAGLASLCMLAALSLGTSTALAAEPPPFNWDSCDSLQPLGQSCQLPRGLAADPNDGHIFVADQSNFRIVELNALGEFIKTWGWDVVESGPDNTGTGFEICTPGKGDSCKAGTEGSGTGQFSAISIGVALDSAGNVYVTDRGFLGTPSLRVQKFDPKGNFQLMFGGEVNKTKTEEVGSTEAERNLCPVDPGNECKAGTQGNGNGQFGEWGIGDFIAIDVKGTPSLADDKVYVGDQNRIQVFDTAGQYKESLALPGETVQSLATDKAGSLYAIYNGEPDVRKLTPTGEELEAPRFAVAGPTATAVDAAGNVFAFSSGSIFEFNSAGNPIASFGGGEFASNSTGLATNLCPGSESPGNLYATNLSESAAFVRSYGTEPIGCFKARTGEANPIEEEGATLTGTVNPSSLVVTECFFEYGTSKSYGQIAQCEDPEAGEIGTGTDPVAVHADIEGLQKGTVYHFRLIAKIGGETETGADEEFKTLGPPVISAERAAKVAFREATLKAQVNPEGFTTAYRFQYTTQADFEAHGFTGAKNTTPVNVGSSGDRTEHAASAELEGLVPGAAYRWRVVAVNSSGETSSADHALITYRTPVSITDTCANAALRTEASAQLPDCRAYEMVSPVDKNGGDIVSSVSTESDPGGWVQTTADGAKLTYGAIFAAFAGEPASLVFNQYMAERQEGSGWSNEGIHPSVPGRLCCEDLSLGLTREFSVFSADLCSAWLYDPQDPPLLSEGQSGFPNLYRRQNCGAGAGSLEALTPSPPALPSGTPKAYVNVFAVQGLSEDNQHVLFVARAKLNDEAAAGTDSQIYDHFGSENHLVSVLPGGGPDETPTSVGSGAAGSPFAGGGNLDNAVSNDGSVVYWTSGIGTSTTGTGKIYVRSHPEQGRVEGECDPAGTKACTRPVSAGPNAFYWTAAKDGSKALYSEGEDLYEYNLTKAENAEPPRRLIASEVKGVAGTSEDLSRIYFISSEALNGEAEGEEAGEPNLYLEEGETFSFVARLAADDMGVEEPGATNFAYSVAERNPYFRATRVTPDGTHIAFESRAPLTGYDSSGGAGGKPAVEVFSYAKGGEVVCVSCNPSGAAPSGVRELRLPYLAAFESNPELQTKVPAAAWIPTWEHKLHASNVLSSDGKRLFFNSNDALLPRDANGAPDVYEWEAAGTGGCETSGANYFAQNGGCLYLISSGEDSRESEFWEADPDGSDVFFTTAASLLPQDPGSIDLYDARIEGGFPQPVPRAECEGEACQSPPPPPAFPTPSSGSYSGPPNAKPNKSCPKGKKKVHKKGKTHCVKKQKKHKSKKGKGKKHNREANNKGRAAR